jgi:ribosomal protein S12 methylthiotransferase
MCRPERQRTIREKLARIREVVPDVAVRTTCIVGFPGETEEDFETLMRFLEEVEFDRVGAFTYSPQEGTRAAQLADDVPESVKLERLERLNELQRLITTERLEARVGATVRALVDVVDERGVMARTQWQADDIDGVTWIRGPGAESATPGSFVDVRLEEVVDDYDFSASLVRTVSAPPSMRRSRALPMAGSHSMGSWGR